MIAASYQRATTSIHCATGIEC